MRHHRPEAQAHLDPSIWHKILELLDHFLCVLGEMRKEVACVNLPEERREYGGNISVVFVSFWVIVADDVAVEGRAMTGRVSNMKQNAMVRGPGQINYGLESTENILSAITTTTGPQPAHIEFGS